MQPKMAFSECIFYVLLLEYLNNFSTEEQVFIECYTKGGSSVRPWRGLGHREHCRRGRPALAEGSGKGTAGTPGLGPSGFSQDRGKTVKIAPRGAGGGVEGGGNLEGSGASRAFLYAYPLIAVAHIIFLLWNADTVFTASQAFRVHWHVVSQDFFFFFFGGGEGREKREREEKALFFSIKEG